METQEDVYRPLLASLLPTIERSGQAQLPMDAEALHRNITRIFHQAQRKSQIDATFYRLRDLLDQDVTKRVTDIVSLVEDDQMHAVAFVFDDESVYVTVRLPEVRVFSFARPTLDAAREACSFFHPVVTRTTQDTLQ